MLFPQRFPIALVATALVAAGLFNGSAVATDDPHEWVRVQGREAQSLLRSKNAYEQLSNYGSFHWGRLKSKQIEALRGKGLTVTIEQDPFELRLGGRSFDPLETAATAGARSADPDGDFHLIQFDGPIRKQWLRALRAQGIELVQPLHPFSYLVWARSAPMASARAMSHVRWSGLMRTEWKLAPAQRFSEAGVRPTMALASAHFDPDRLIEELGRFGRVDAITPLGRHYKIVQMQADGRDYASIADIPAILTAQYVPPEAGPRGELSNQSVVGGIDGSGQVFTGYANWLNDTGFDGNGITVGVVDASILTTHQDLADRIAPCSGTNGSCSGSGSSDHGTHVAGAIAGTGATGTEDNNGFLRGQGVAPGASIITQRYGPFLGAGEGGMVADGMLQIFQDSVISGALLTNNSWGPTGTPQGYDIPTQQIDFISRDADPDTPGNQPVLAVWSIMNGDGDASGACAPSSVGSPDEAKNLFAVGSTALQRSDGIQQSDIFSVSSNSAHGPACDGRRVPHIVAPGCLTDSTSNAGDTDTAHTLKCGTSMASPVVSGSIAVWAERYIAETGLNPSPALVKAAFTAAARNLEGQTNADGGVMSHRPDRFQGYGRLDLDSVINHGSSVLLYDQRMVFDDSGQNWSLEFQPDNPGEPVRIMLSWTDAPGHGLGGDTPAWVNNLDLDVDTGGYSYLGNVIGADGWSAGGGTPDGRNNLEGVFLSPAQLGEVASVRVIASELAGDALNPYDPGDAKQDFALACYNCETYTMAAEPRILEACIPQPGDENQYDVAVNLASVGDYGGDVALTASGMPVGVTETRIPEQVTLPGLSTWTLTVGEPAVPGESTIFIDGNDGKLQNSDRLKLDLDAYLETAPSLSSPADGADAGSLQPTFSWESLPDVEQYRIQIATDQDFNNKDVVFEQTLAETTFMPPSELDFAGSYFWRVQGINNCDGGEWSNSRSVFVRVFADRFESKQES